MLIGMRWSYQCGRSTDQGCSAEGILCELKSHWHRSVMVKFQMNIGDVFLWVGREERGG